MSQRKWAELIIAAFLGMMVFGWAVAILQIIDPTIQFFMAIAFGLIIYRYVMHPSRR